MASHSKRLSDAFLMSTHSICFKIMTYRKQSKKYILSEVYTAILLTGLSAPSMEYKTCSVRVVYHLIDLELRAYQEYKLVLFNLVLLEELFR